MKKLTALIQGPETTVDLQDTILTTGNEYVFIKKASIFWEYKNVKERFIAIRKPTGGVIYADPGYYTFDDVKDLISADDVVVLDRRYDGKCEIVNNGKSDLLVSQLVCNFLGLTHTYGSNVFRPIGPGVTLVSENKSNINLGLRYINVSCNLVDTTVNYTNGRKSSVITSLPVTTSQSLFGSVTSYIDTESKVPVIKGAFGEVKFTVSDQDGNPVDIGEVLVELYIT